MNDTMTLVEKTVFLSTVEVLRGVPTEALAQLAARATEVRVDRGRTLFREGDDDRGIFIVIEGEIQLRKRASVVRHLRAGAAHGELFAGENEPHEYTAVALADSHLLNLEQAAVVEALLEYPEFGLAMVRDLSLRMHKLTQRVIELEAELRRRGRREPLGDGEALEPPSAATDAPRQRQWWRRRRKPRTA